MAARNLHRVSLRYPRTLDQAFNTPRYASAVELPAPPLWKRIVRAFWSWA
jgi:hypothetical protein